MTKELCEILLEELNNININKFLISILIFSVQMKEEDIRKLKLKRKDGSQVLLGKANKAVGRVGFIMHPKVINNIHGTWSSHSGGHRMNISNDGDYKNGCSLYANHC